MCLVLEQIPNITKYIYLNANKMGEGRNVTCGLYWASLGAIASNSLGVPHAYNSGHPMLVPGTSLKGDSIFHVKGKHRLCDV
jgi:hypothetical protein